MWSVDCYLPVDDEEAERVGLVMGASDRAKGGVGVVVEGSGPSSAVMTGWYAAGSSAVNMM